MRGEILLKFDEMKESMMDRQVRTVNGPKKEAFFGKMEEESNNTTNSVHKFEDHTYIYYSTAATYFRLSGRHQVDRLNYYRHVLKIFTFFFN
jgi:hypothetical protein